MGNERELFPLENAMFHVYYGANDQWEQGWMIRIKKLYLGVFG